MVRRKASDSGTVQTFCRKKAQMKLLTGLQTVIFYRGNLKRVKLCSSSNRFCSSSSSTRSLAKQPTLGADSLSKCRDIVWYGFISAGDTLTVLVIHI